MERNIQKRSNLAGDRNFKCFVYGIRYCYLSASSFVPCPLYLCSPSHYQLCTVRALTLIVSSSLSTIFLVSVWVFPFHLYFSSGSLAESEVSHVSSSAFFSAAITEFVFYIRPFHPCVYERQSFRIFLGRPQIPHILVMEFVPQYFDRPIPNILPLKLTK